MAHVWQYCSETGVELIIYYQNPELFGKKLKDLRLAKKLKVEEVGRAIGWWPDNIRRWENGEMVSIRVLEEISDFYNVTTDYLLSENMEKEEQLQLF